VVVWCSFSSNRLTTSDLSASMACEAVTAVCVNCSDTVCVDAPDATVVCVSSPDSPFTAAREQPGKAAAADTEVSAWTRISTSASMYADAELERRLWDSALIVWRNEV
jgi:hypothetical protein